jgi:hypothetical protein
MADFQSFNVAGDSCDLFDHLPAFTRLSVSSYCESLASNEPSTASGGVTMNSTSSGSKAVASGGSVHLHPALVKLALQIQHGVISGSNARCLALLMALKALVQDYETPKGCLLNREMQTELRAHMHFIDAFRSQSVSMVLSSCFLFCFLTLQSASQERDAFASLIHVVAHLSNSRYAGEAAGCRAYRPFRP